MSAISMQLTASAVPKLELRDPRWDILLKEAKARFGVDALRPGQRDLIDSVQGRDAPGILPTGGGKSLTYQLPALVLPKTVVVVSPLIALMKDQRDHLDAAGIQVVELDSTIGVPETRSSESAIRDGARCIVYVTPERCRPRRASSSCRSAASRSSLIHPIPGTRRQTWCSGIVQPKRTICD